MKILKDADRRKIKEAFNKMKNKDDLLALLNFAKKLLYGENAYPFQIQHINYYSNPNINKNRYIEFSIKKKSGGERVIYAPSAGLKAIQKCLNLIFQTVYSPHKAAKGFVPNKSIVDNAKLHTGKIYVYNIDLKDFFPSIDQARVWGRLQYPPFNLNKKTERLELAGIIASLCCNEMEVNRLDENGEWCKVLKNVLPQGAPTSPTLSNIVCEKMDYYLTAVAKRFNLKYSRYADDITFSSMHNVYQEDSEFIKELHRIITEQNFHIQECKTRLQQNCYRQEVTGLVVNEKINVKKRYIKQLRMWLYLWEHYGYDKANKYFQEQYKGDKGHISKRQPDLAKVIKGKLNYLKMVKGQENTAYEKLLERFNKLTDIKIPALHTPIKLAELLQKFSSNDSILKYATHSWDNGKDYSDFVKKLDKNGKKITYEIRKLNENLGNKIYAFLYGERPWGIHKVKYGWRNKEVKDWASKNITKSPFEYPLPEPFEVEGKKIESFGQVIDIFKNEIEIRNEGDQLKKLFQNLKMKHLKGFDFKYKDLEGKSFYTDVQHLSYTIERIFEEIKKRKKHKEVIISAKDEQNYTEVTILHLGSICLGEKSDKFKNKIKKGDFGSIFKKLKNLCDWSIESDFDDGSFRINYLTSKKDEKWREPIEKVGGFKHIFKFYMT